MRGRSHFYQHILPVLICSRGLRVQNKRYGEKAFDPFDQLVPTMCLECVFNSVAGRHGRLGEIEESGGEGWKKDEAGWVNSGYSTDILRINTKGPCVSKWKATGW